MANHMLQYMVAHSIADRVPNSKIIGYDIPEWGLQDLSKPKRAGKVVKIMIQRFEPEFAAELLAKEGVKAVKLRTPCSNVEALPPLDKARAMFDDADTQAYETGDGDIVIHLRLEDSLAGANKHYGPIPIKFYERVIEASGKKPVFVGQIGDDWYSNALTQRFPDAVFLKGGSVLHDFETLRRAKHVVPAVSTFSWVASWLSAATTIHFPIYGVLNPLQFPEVDLLPVTDPRYRFYLFPVRHWRGTPDQISEVLEGASGQLINREDAENLRDRGRALWQPRYDQWKQEFMPDQAAAPLAPAVFRSRRALR